MKAHRVTPLPCPACGRSLDAALGTGPTDRQPHDGDLTICIACRAIVVFVGDPVDGLRYPDADEMGRFLTDPAGTNAIRAVAEYHRRRR